MSTTHPIKLMTLLAAAVLTTACQSKQATSAPSSSTVPSNQKMSSAQVKTSESKVVSPSSASPSSKENKPQSPAPSVVTASSQSSSTADSSAMLQGQAQTTANPPTSKTYVSQINSEAIVNGDFSSLAGTWVNAKGQRVVFDKNGYVPQEAEPVMSMSSMTLNADTGVLSANFSNNKDPFGVGILVIPAGKVMTTDMTPDERDHIEIGQSLASLEERYYKQ